MWTDDQLDQADYVVYHDAESGQFLNVGTVEIQGTAYQGPYICTPMPPFGSLKNGAGLSSLGHGVHVPVKRLKNVRHPAAFPHEAYGDKTVLHQLPNGDV